MSNTATGVRPGALTFAGVMLIVLGALNLIHGWQLLDNNKLLEDNLLVSTNMDTWGWIILIFGILQLFAGIGIMRGTGGRGLGVTLACIGMVIWFMFLFVAPWSALIGTGLNFAIIASLLSTEQ